MDPITLSLAVLISICAALFAVSCAVVCWREASAFSSMKKRLRELESSVEPLSLRVKEIEMRYQSVAKRYALESRRDPETGKAAPAVPAKAETKEDVRRRLGLVGANAARVAHSIHAQGGLRR